MKKMTQLEVIEIHLETYGKITSWEAFTDYGITRLSDIIYRLRRNGKNIINKNLTGVTRLGNTCVYAEYTLIR